MSEDYNKQPAKFRGPTSIDDSESTGFGKMNIENASVVNLTPEEREREIIRCQNVIK